MLSMMASKIAYENKSFITSVVKNTWKMDFVGYYDCYNAFQGKNLTQAFVFKASDTNPNLIVVSFRGTELFSSDDWCTDLDISWYVYVLKNVGKVHAGFSRALGLQQNGWPKENISLIHQYAYYTIRQKLRDMLARDKNLKNLAFVFYEICHLHEINVRYNKLSYLEFFFVLFKIVLALAFVCETSE
ncbi:unnamed protein product [Brassica oleracea var. botrytis]